MGMLSWVVLVFMAGGSDRVDVLFNISYTSQIWVYRVLVFVGPVVVGLITWWMCKELQAIDVVERRRSAAEHEAKMAEGPA